MIDEKLKPCPSCPLNGLYVECNNCMCRLMPATWHYDEEDEAVEAWNRRANDDAT